MLLEPGPVILVSTTTGGKNNIMTISWHMVMDFTPQFALVTGAWNLCPPYRPPENQKPPNRMNQRVL
ncbi:MAG: hypothetical protein LLG13_00645 [Bacteroidales bacterium]|nr:hypothetical protein [Bacteroidales bacterium]